MKFPLILTLLLVLAMSSRSTARPTIATDELFCTESLDDADETCLTPTVDRSSRSLSSSPENMHFSWPRPDVLARSEPIQQPSAVRLCRTAQTPDVLITAYGMSAEQFSTFSQDVYLMRQIVTNMKRWARSFHPRAVFYEHVFQCVLGETRHVQADAQLSSSPSTTFIPTLYFDINDELTRALYLVQQYTGTCHGRVQIELSHQVPLPRYEEWAQNLVLGARHRIQEIQAQGQPVPAQFYSFACLEEPSVSLLKADPEAMDPVSILFRTWSEEQEYY